MYIRRSTSYCASSKKLEIVELFNEMKRLQEERQLLIKEMKNYIHFYCDVVLPSLSKDIAGMYIRTYRVYTYICTIHVLSNFHHKYVASCLRT